MSHNVGRNRRRFLGAAPGGALSVVSRVSGCAAGLDGGARVGLAKASGSPARETAPRPSQFMAVIAGQGECNENCESRGGPNESRPL